MEARAGGWGVGGIFVGVGVDWCGLVWMGASLLLCWCVGVCIYVISVDDDRMAWHEMR